MRVVAAKRRLWVRGCVGAFEWVWRERVCRQGEARGADCVCLRARGRLASDQRARRPAPRPAPAAPACVPRWCPHPRPTLPRARQLCFLATAFSSALFYNVLNAINMVRMARPRARARCPAAPACQLRRPAQSAHSFPTQGARPRTPACFPCARPAASQPLTPFVALIGVTWLGRAKERTNKRTAAVAPHAHAPGSPRRSLEQVHVLSPSCNPPPSPLSLPPAGLGRCRKTCAS